MGRRAAQAEDVRVGVLPARGFLLRHRHLMPGLLTRQGEGLPLLPRRTLRRLLHRLLDRSIQGALRT